MACTLSRWAPQPPEPAAGGRRGIGLGPLPLLPGGQPPSAARPHHALRVGMAPPSVVALREQQDVLAERRQEAAAQRAAVRGRLAVLGSACLPPPGCVGHLSRGWHRSLDPPLSCPQMEQRDERIIVETDRHRITGSLRLPADGYRSRLTDYLNSSEREFLALTDVELTSLQGTPEVQRRDFIALSVRHIVLAMPAEDDEA